MRSRSLSLAAAALLLAASVPKVARAWNGEDDHENEGKVRHVLLISVDGMHAVDLSNWVHDHPNSFLAKFSKKSLTYSGAHTTTPSDSFPGLLAQVTGGTPKSTGVYYDDSYDRTLYAPGTNCSIPAGSEIVYDESVDYNMDYLFSGGLNPANLPLGKDATGCHPVYPHSFLKVNTIFEVAHKAHRYTAWSDKHPAYDIVRGPSGTGVDDLYTPEIYSMIKNGGTVNGVNLTATLALCDGTNSLPPAKVSVYTDCMPSQIAYDEVKVRAILNEIAGRSCDGTQKRPVPAIFGMNFQSVSVGEKLPIGGYQDAVGTPTPNLEKAFEFVDGAIGRMVDALEDRDLLEKTAVIISAKHGQSPINYKTLAMESGATHAPVQTVQDPLGYVNNADPNVDNILWTNNNTTGPTQGKQYAVDGHLQTDDVGIVWLQDQSASNIANVVAQLQANTVSMFANTLPPGTVFQNNISYGPALAKIFGDPTSSDPVASARAPDIFIQPNAGVIYSGSSKKIAEHGGGTVDDTNVALLVYTPGGEGGKQIHKPVTTTQIAPTILKLLDLDPDDLQAVRKEHTKVLPGLCGERGDD